MVGDEFYLLDFGCDAIDAVELDIALDEVFY